MKRLIFFAGAAVLSAGASAGTFIGTWNFSMWDTVKANGVTENTVKFDVVRNTPTGGTDILLPGNPTHFITFCAELTENIGAGTNTHNNVELLIGNGSQQTVAGGVVFDFLRTNRLEKLWGIGTTFTTSADYAAFQLAQWNLLFDTDLNLSGGAFNGIGTNGAILTAAQNLLNGLDSRTNRAAVYLMSGAGIQDQLTTVPGRPPGGNSVPEPFTMSLGAAAAGVFVRRRLKSKRA